MNKKLFFFLFSFYFEPGKQSQLAGKLALYFCLKMFRMIKNVITICLLCRVNPSIIFSRFISLFNFPFLLAVSLSLWKGMHLDTTVCSTAITYIYPHPIIRCHITMIEECTHIFFLHGKFWYQDRSIHHIIRSRQCKIEWLRFTYFTYHYHMSHFLPSLCLYMEKYRHIGRWWWWRWC